MKQAKKNKEQRLIVIRFNSSLAVFRKIGQLVDKYGGLVAKEIVVEGSNDGRVHPTNCPVVKAVEGLEHQIIPPSHKGEWE